jgi:enoyl-CoA hydratase/carnithine racemase
MMEEGLPQLERSGPIATIRLRRPSQRNSLHDADLHTLLDIFQSLDADPVVKVVVLTAQTQDQKRPVFSAGYHVSGFESGQHDPRLFEKIPNALEALRPITVCALNGSVYGGATNMVLACDLCLALAGSEWRMPATAIGLHYYPTGLRRYVQRLGLSVTKRAFLTGRAIAVEDLAATGVFERVVASDEWDAQVDALARDIAALSPQAAQASKRSLNEIGAGLYDEVQLRVRETSSHLSADFAEGLTAIREKRAPKFVQD